MITSETGVISNKIYKHIANILSKYMYEDNGNIDGQN